MNLQRIAQTIDVDAMQQSHVTMIGGAYGLVKSLVHCGLGAVTMVDFDRIDSSNPARQDFYSTDLGQYKTEATAADLRKINPKVEIECYTQDYCSLSRQQHDALFGHTDLFIFATDSFPAQARGNFEAVRLSIPAIWIGLYKGGRAGEIVFYVPGKTSACYRCICSGRYQAFQSGNGNTNISSEGGTIHDLHLVDAIVGQVATGILTDGEENRMRKLIGQLEKRNLLKVTMNPDYGLGDNDIFWQVLGINPSKFSFTTIALPQERDETYTEYRI